MSDEVNRQSEMQGEGDKEAAREYNEATRDFVESGKVSEATENNGEQDPAEAERAERAGRDRAKEKDPSVSRD